MRTSLRSAELAINRQVSASTQLSRVAGRAFNAWRPLPGSKAVIQTAAMWKIGTEAPPAAMGRILPEAIFSIPLGKFFQEILPVLKNTARFVR